MNVVAERTKTWTENSRGRLQYVLQNYVLWFVIVVLLIVAAIITPSYVRPGNLMLVLRQAAPLGIVAVGQLMVVLVSGLDLSVGQLMGTAAVVAGLYINGETGRDLPAILLVIAMGIGVGFVNGIVITKRRVEPFIMTLAMMVILQGYIWNYSKGAKMGAPSPGLRELALGYIGPVPIQVVIWIVVVIVVAVALHKTPFGRWVYAVGGNREAARLSGVNVDLVTTICYIICALTAVLAGLILLGYIGVSDARTGNGYELGSIAAVVVGGASLAGGQGTINGNIAGVLILTLIGSLLNAFSVSAFSAQIVRGAIIIAAVAWYMRNR